MPSRRFHYAPYFSGRVSDPIEDFLDEYEELANSCGLTDRQKVETIIRYIHLTLRDLWKSIDGYIAHDWMNFRRELDDISKSCMNEEGVQYYTTIGSSWSSTNL
jgi:hypothetical protein